MGMSRRAMLRRAAAGLAMLCAASGPGCGAGGAPADGDRAVLPPTYKAREKEIADSMINAMKTQRASRGRRAQPASSRTR